jgi:hypothetical protein
MPANPSNAGSTAIACLRYRDAPRAIAHAQTRTTWLVGGDADAVYERVIDIVDEEYGGRGFTCRDLEGHSWRIGAYHPWQQ